MYSKIIFFSLLIMLLLFNLFFNTKKSKNKRLITFKKKFLSKESYIEKIYSRYDEKTTLDPSINISISLYEKEDNISNKANIHRARLAKFRKSKLNGEFIYLDKNDKVFKYIKGKKFFIE